MRSMAMWKCTTLNPALDQIAQLGEARNGGPLSSTATYALLTSKRANRLSPFPPFMGVIVSSNVTQSGSVITGDIKDVVIVKTNPGYAPDPGRPGTGTLVGGVG